MRTIERQLFDVVAISWLTSVSKPEIYRAIEKGRLVAPVILGRRRATRQQINDWLGVNLPVQQ